MKLGTPKRLVLGVLVALSVAVPTLAENQAAPVAA